MRIEDSTIYCDECDWSTPAATGPMADLQNTLDHETHAQEAGHPQTFLDRPRQYFPKGEDFNLYED